MSIKDIKIVCGCARGLIDKDSEEKSESRFKIPAGFVTLTYAQIICRDV